MGRRREEFDTRRAINVLEVMGQGASLTVYLLGLPSDPPLLCPEESHAAQCLVGILSGAGPSRPYPAAVPP